MEPRGSIAADVAASEADGPLVSGSTDPAAGDSTDRATASVACDSLGESLSASGLVFSSSSSLTAVNNLVEMVRRAGAGAGRGRVDGCGSASSLEVADGWGDAGRD